MALFDPYFRRYLRYIFSSADLLVSRRALNGLISDENDFTSKLTFLIDEFFYLKQFKGRNIFRQASFSVRSNKMKSNPERHFGSDAYILLVDYSSNQFKVCFFEAKSNRDNWDKVNSGESHFSSQIRRQRNAIDRGYAVWEQFYPYINPKKKLSPHRYQFGSSCIIHHNAYVYMLNNVTNPLTNISRAWSDQDIDNLCISQTQSITMGGMIFLASECLIGTPQKIDKNFSVNGYIESLDLGDESIVMAVEYGKEDFDKFKMD